jgi:hypothetical protein
MVIGSFFLFSPKPASAANLALPSLDRPNAASAESLHSGVSASQFAHITSDPHSSCHPPF